MTQPSVDNSEAAGDQAKASPPDGLPIYRLLTGKDDAAFCHRVSEALAAGYLLYGSPAATFNGQDVIVAQAIIWPTAKSRQASP
jgi:hypothetical protein